MMKHLKPDCEQSTTGAVLPLRALTPSIAPSQPVGRDLGTCCSGEPAQFIFLRCTGHPYLLPAGIGSHSNPPIQLETGV
jgi:hypothetical protein